MLWQWEGTQPRPTYGKPDAMAQRGLNELIGEPFSFDVWIPRAQQLARELGPAAIPNLLASMTWPPRPTGGTWRVLDWTQRAQIAIAIVLAYIDEGWQGSQRQQVLYGLLYGPSDWTTGAAIVALGVLARQDPTIRRDVEQAFGWMRTQIPAEGFCAWAFPLSATWISLGDHPPAFLAELAAWQQQLTSAVGQSTVYVCELEAKKRDQAEAVGQAQTAAAQISAGAGGDPDPTVFPDRPVAKLSDYVKMMKMMQTGNMMGALAAYGLDMMGYATVATAWGQKLAGEPTLNAKFATMMAR